MAFAQELLTFLHSNKEHFGYYFLCDNFLDFRELYSNEEEGTYIMRGGDPREVDWCPNTQKVASFITNKDCDIPCTIVLWSRVQDNAKPLEEIYEALQKLEDLEYVIARRHPNGLTSLEVSLTDVSNHLNYDFIAQNISKL